MNPTQLWSTDHHGERWLGALDNPAVFLANPPKRRGTYKKGKTPAHLRPYLFKPGHQAARRNPPAAVTKYKNPGGGQMVQWIRSGAQRAKKRAQTGMMGFRSQFPALPMIGGGALGFVAPSWIAKAVNAYAPSVSASPLLFWGVRIVSAILPGWLVRKFASGAFGVAMLIGGMIRLVVDGLQAFAPSLLGAQPRLGYYTAGVVAGALPEGGRGRLGQYTPPDAYPMNNPGTPMINSVPSRLDPRRRL